MGKKKNALVKVSGPSNAHLYKRGDVYWIRANNRNKKPLQKSLFTKTLSTARILRDEELAKYYGEKRLSNAISFLVEDKFPEFLELKKTKSKGTYDSISNQWKNHLKHGLGHLLISEVSETEWLKYVQNKRKSYKDRKFFNDRKYLVMFLNWLHRDGLIQKVPKLPDVDPEIAEGKVYTDEQLESLISRATTDLKLQILMGVTMGMRIGEIMSLEWNQIDFHKRTIYLPAHKTKIRKERTFGISKSCYDLLVERSELSQGLAVFASPRNPDKHQGRDGNKKIWASCKRMAGVPKEYKFHWLRHTFLTHAFKKSVNPALICEYAGLSLEEAQRTYLHFTVEDTRVVASLVEVKAA